MVPTPHFFKIILEETIQEGKLRIPRKFARKYGNDLSDPVFLKVPNGLTWQLQLTKCDARGVWSLNGFQSFAKHYSLQLGHFLIFRYDGKSNFWVIICDTSAVEIEYPVDNGNAFKFSGESSNVPRTQETEHDVSLEILDDLSPRRETRNGSRRNGGNLEKQKRKPGSDEGFEDTAMKPPAGTKKLGALQMASSYKSKNPFFMVLMHPSYVLNKYYLSIPTNVTKKHFLMDHGYINLLSNGGSWPVKYVRYNTSSKNQFVQFRSGWKVFVQDNKVVVGDVCVFEMISGSELSLHVIIFRGCEDANSDQWIKRPGLEETDDVSVEVLEKMSIERRGTQSNAVKVKLEKPKRKLDLSSKQDLADEGLGGCVASGKKRMKFVSQIPEIEHDVSLEILNDLSPKRETGVRTRRNGLNQKRKPDSVSSNEGFKVMKPPAGTDKLGALQMASSFKSKNPFFMVPMQPSYVLSTCKLIIPVNVTEKHFLMDHGYINLLVSNGGPWRVKYVRYNASSRKKQIVQFMSGWNVFVQDNKLVVGDVCVFEMISGSELSLHVVIFRACEDANSDQWRNRSLQIEETDNVSVENLEKTAVHCPGPQKMSNEPRGTQSNGVKMKLEKPKRKLDLSSKLDLADESLGECIANGQKRFKFGTVKARRMTSYSYTEKARALQMASSLIKPESPFFLVLMQPSYVIAGLRLIIPTKFVDQYFPKKNHGEINLQISNDRTWHVKYISRVSYNSRKVEFTSGWMEFMEENNLEVGDVCVFELIKGTNFALKVTVLRFNEYACDNSERMKLNKTKELKDDFSLSKREEKKVHKTNELEDDFSLFKGEEKTSQRFLQSHEIMRTEPKGTQINGLTVEKPIKNLNISSMHSLADNSRLLTYQESSAEYSSEYPFFIRTMRRSYFEGCLSVPRKFAEMYIKERSHSVHLQVAKESWTVLSRIYEDGSCKFIHWSAFAKANSLREGDVCMFELIKRNNMLFKVSIIRYLDAQIKK